MVGIGSKATWMIGSESFARCAGDFNMKTSVNLHQKLKHRSIAYAFQPFTNVEQAISTHRLTTTSLAHTADWLFAVTAVLRCDRTTTNCVSRYDPDFRFYYLASGVDVARLTAASDVRYFGLTNLSTTSNTKHRNHNSSS
jgi:hypothetical protein